MRKLHAGAAKMMVVFFSI